MSPFFPIVTYPSEAFLKQEKTYFILILSNIGWFLFGIDVMPFE